MPHYYFDLIDHVTVEDHGGQVLTDDFAAKRVGDELARKIFEVQPEMRNKGYSIRVRDFKGHEIHRAQIELFAIRPPLSN